MPPRCQLVRHPLARGERGEEHLGILMDGQGAVPPIGGHPVPRQECVGQAFQRRLQLRVVAQQDVLHLGLGHPVDSGLGVDLGPEFAGEEAIALEPPGGHQDEDPERRVREPEPGRQRLRVHPHLQVHPVDVVVVDAADLLGPLPVARELVE